MAPGKDELLVGRPFVGGAGRVLAAALAHANTSIESCKLTNVINCYPMGKGETISAEQIKSCRGRLVSEVEAAHPSSILALGSDALYALTGLGPISDWQGFIVEPHMSKGVKVGREILGPVRLLCPVVPAFHPSLIMRMGLKPIEWLFRPTDRAVRIARGNVVRWEPPSSTTPSPSPVIGIDIETKGEEITLVGLAGEGWASNSPDLDVHGILKGPGIKVVQNLAFDKPRLEAQGYTITGPYWDTMLAQHLIDPDGMGFSLNELAPYWLDCHRWKHEPGPHPKEPKIKSWKRDFKCVTCGNSGTSGVGAKDLRTCITCAEGEYQGVIAAWEKSHEKYNLKDVASVIPIYEGQVRALRRTNQIPLFTSMMEVVSEVLIPLAGRGLRVDVRKRDRVVAFYQKKEGYALRHLSQWLGGDFNPYANKHIHKLLYTDWNLPVQRKRVKGGEGNVTADEEAIHRLADGASTHQQKRVLRCVLRARGAHKYWKTYGDIGERIYPRYSPTAKESDAGGKRTIAATGRILARGDRGTRTPPIQQIPKSVRGVFVPEVGHLFVQGDWRQQELRLIAHFSECKFILDSLDRKPDFFDILSGRYSCDRVRAKNLFYGLWAYGGSAKAGQRALGSKGFRISLAECEGLVADGRRLVPELFEWHQKTYAQVRRDRYYRNPFGRVRHFPSPKASFNEILNFPVQSTGADMLWAVLKPVDLLAREFGGELKILVHDSICCSVPKNRSDGFSLMLRAEMEREWKEVGEGFSVPVEIKVGENWGKVS